MTEMFRHPEASMFYNPEGDKRWICSRCSKEFDYRGFMQEADALLAVQDPPRYCPECGVADFGQVSMTMEVELPETWEEVRTTKEIPPTTPQLEDLLASDDRIDLWHRALEELLQRRKADLEALQVLIKLGYRSPICYRAAHELAYRKATAVSVLVALVAQLVERLDTTAKMALEIIDRRVRPALVFNADQMVKDKLAKAMTTLNTVAPLEWVDADKLDQAVKDRLAKRVQILEQALVSILASVKGIANADWRAWGELSSLEEFEAWAKSRARFSAELITDTLTDHAKEQK
jgi:DNA-directed RNA polymerase subunit RPC12/RpoP